MPRISNTSFQLAAFALLWTAAANGQNPPAAAPPDDEDLEVPAARPATPGASAPQSPANPTQASDHEPGAAAPSTPAPAQQAAPTQAAPVQTAPAQAAPAALAGRTPAANAATGTAAARSRNGEGTGEPEGPVNLERRAYTRPVPSGLKIGGYIHAQYQHNAISEDQLQQGALPLNQNQFVVRRARLRVDRGWEYVAGTLELDASTVGGPHVGIRRADASIFYRGSNTAQMPPLVMLSAGIIDLPFGFELAESARVRWFMERSLGSLALFPTEMDAGVKLSGAASFVRYAVAVSNGEPVDEHGFPSDPNAAKDVTGRFGAEVIIDERLEISGGTSFAVGEGFHAGQDAGKSTVTWNDVNQDGVAQPTELLGLPGSAATPSENFARWAIGLDLQFGLRSTIGFSRLFIEAFVASNHDRGFAPSDPIASTIDQRQAGGYLALTQEITQYGIIGFRASIYDPNADVLETRAGRILPRTQTVRTLSPLAGLVLPNRARLLFQYDFVRDYLARDAVGVPTDADNDQWTLRLQVEL